MARLKLTSAALRYIQCMQASHHNQNILHCAENAISPEVYTETLCWQACMGNYCVKTRGHFGDKHSSVLSFV